MAAEGGEETVDQKDPLLDDENFKKLSNRGTGLDEFLELVKANVLGYFPRKKLAALLKAKLGLVEQVEKQMDQMKHLGPARARKMTSEEIVCMDNYLSSDIRQKHSSLNGLIQTMLDEGQLTAEEKPLIQAQLQTRIEAAKAANKEKLAEKLLNNASNVRKAKPIKQELFNKTKLLELTRDRERIKLLEQQPKKRLTLDEREFINSKSKIQEDLLAEGKASQSWFETDQEFMARLETALAVMAADIEKAMKEEEEQAWERKRVEEEKAAEQKRLEEQAKEAKKAKELADKIEARRQEAAAKPQKAVPEKKKKEKPAARMMNPFELFQEPPRPTEEESEKKEAEEDWGEEAWDESWTQPEVPKSAPAKTQEAPKPAPAKEPEKVKATAKASKPKRAPLPVPENKWGAPAAVPDGFLEEVAEEDTGPSLADAMKKGVKKPPPAAPPDKKEKKKWGKVDAADFFMEPPVVENGHDSHEVENGDHTAWTAKAPEPVVEKTEAPKPAPVVEVKKQSTKRVHKPVEFASKWGGAAAKQDAVDEDDEELPSLAAAVKKGTKKPPAQVNRVDPGTGVDSMGQKKGWGKVDGGEFDFQPEDRVVAENGDTNGHGVSEEGDEQSNASRDEEEEVNEEPEESVKPVVESKWGAAPVAPAAEEEEAAGPSLAEAAKASQAGPTLADAAKAGPGKKGKKKMAKMSAGDLGFEY